MLEFLRKQEPPQRKDLQLETEAEVIDDPASAVADRENEDDKPELCKHVVDDVCQMHGLSVNPANPVACNSSCAK
ncbi:hypothetical protein LCGC14_0561400 [marine sediment metagenome]|uniref:Uncharacterized protein n=1 Tax=marine sediment metagenome TaxID=412755 RepID=A0A0F9UV52_9ZZZZ